MRDSTFGGLARQEKIPQGRNPCWPANAISGGVGKKLMESAAHARGVRWQERPVDTQDLPGLAGQVRVTQAREAAVKQGGSRNR